MYNFIPLDQRVIKWLSKDIMIHSTQNTQHDSECDKHMQTSCFDDNQSTSLARYVLDFQGALILGFALKRNKAGAVSSIRLNVLS